MTHETFWITILVLNPALAVAAIVELRLGELEPNIRNKRILSGQPGDNRTITWRLMALAGVVQAGFIFALLLILPFIATDLYRGDEPSSAIYDWEHAALLVVSISLGARLLGQAISTLEQLWPAGPPSDQTATHPTGEPPKVARRSGADGQPDLSDVATSASDPTSGEQD